ncbi:hypothetical protein Y032_0136g1961 [Ancylostoma ceylanicum]|uniref:Cation efflux protein transmembrane domain-containing protein n=2 Tax=Ancylostoma ceylanicum TaxID=53326 RepID=A0A016T585_9BILA|nr:hypothetical protein Y032_0136g1961 [Ancylostoma ceylanicum]
MMFDKGVQTMIIMAIVNVCNLILVGVKAVVAYNTGSFSIANSTLETFGDVFVGFLLLLQRLQARIVKDDRYPRGRATESLSNVVASVVMLVMAGVNAVLNIDRFVTNKFDPHMELEHIGVVTFNIILKILLFGICYIRKDVDQVNVLLKDQGVDVITNGTAVVFAVFTKYFHKNWDIVGAAIIFITICRNWLPILFTNCNRIHGIAPKSSKMEKIWEVVNGLNEIETVHDLVAYHRGQDVIVELYAEMKLSVPTKLEATRLKVTMSLEEIEFVGTAYVFHDVTKKTPDEKQEPSEESKCDDSLLKVV